MPISHANRWKCQIMSPVSTEVLWEGEGPTTKSIVEKYTKEVNNTFLTIQKLNRCSLGRSKNPLIRLVKVGEFGRRNIAPEIRGYDSPSRCSTGTDSVNLDFVET